ncbi:glycosyltransferase [Geomonas terrae]|uniref:Glycosyltransferase n=1 Tax=Geomonas terrae TaxID=2562681 RepID=A0A4V3NZN3_9BACT|nr:glycosyltransferase [Geomonas terrae]TGU72362.1 glycosyltransferase [Geomonas terrae]
MTAALTKTRIVVPCYNEAKRLKPEAFIVALEDDPDLSFLFVNDGSTDATFEVLRALQSEAPARIAVMDLERNCGKAEAVRLGMLDAAHGAYDLVGYWDADLATPLSAIGDLCSVFENKDVDAVFGSRVRLLGRNIRRRPARHYLGRVFATCASLLLRLHIYDTQCGAKLFRNSSALRAVLSVPFKVRWIFDVELLARFPLVMEAPDNMGAERWVKYPLREWVDVKGSKVTVSDYFKASLEFGILLLYLRSPAGKTYRRYLQEAQTEPLPSRT